MEIEKTPVQEGRPVREVRPIIQRSGTPSVEQLPGGLYFKVGGKEPVCMFADGPDVIIVHLSWDDAQTIASWLRDPVVFDEATEAMRRRAGL